MGDINKAYSEAFFSFFVGRGQQTSESSAIKAGFEAQGVYANV